MIANLAEHQFWKQSNHLVSGRKLWEALREVDPSFTCAKLFWWYNMYSSADYSITPRPMYPADGARCSTSTRTRCRCGRKSKATLASSRSAASGGQHRTSNRPAGSRNQPSGSSAGSALASRSSTSPTSTTTSNASGASDISLIAKDLKEIDDVVADLIDCYERHQVKVVLLSEYGITDVSRPVHLNRLFRQGGWLQVKEELGREILDLGASRAFAIADHQVAHIYLNDPSILTEVQSLCEQTPGVGQVLAGEAQVRAGMAHERAGDLIAIADADSWFTYYYWQQDRLAPDFARCVDIHRKPGYDPVELFIDPTIKLPKLKIATRLLKKKLGFRMLMDLIPLDANLVRGSHGRIPEDPADWPIIAGDLPSLRTNHVDSSEVFAHLYAHCSAGRGYQK